MNKTLQFIKTALIYFLGNILNKIITFLLLPLYTSYLAPDQFGYFDVSISILGVVVPLVFFQIWDGVFRYIYDYDSSEDKYIIVTNGLFLMALSLSIYSLLYVIIASMFSFEFKTVIFIYGVLTAFQYFYSMITRAFGKNMAFMISGVISSLVTIILNILLIVVFKMGSLSLYISMIIGVSIQIVILENYMMTMKNIRKSHLNKNMVMQLLKFSIPLGIGTISYWLLTGLSKVLVSNQLGMAESGIYAISNRFSGMIAIIINVFQLSWNEVSFSIANNENRSSYYSKGINMLLKFVIWGTLILIPLTKLIFPFFVSNEYQEALLIMPIVYFSTMINALGGFLGSLFLAEKQSNIMFYSTIIAAILNICLILFLLPRIGLYGAAISLAVAFFANTLIRIIMLNKLHKIQFDYIFIFYSSTIYILSSAIFYVGNIFWNALLLLILSLMSIYIFKDTLIIVMKRIKTPKI